MSKLFRSLTLAQLVSLSEYLRDKWVDTWLPYPGPEEGRMWKHYERAYKEIEYRRVRRAFYAPW